jgi:rare lipoprotein A (peptidoglycan hydrolase)
VSPALAQRQLALLGIALLAVVVGLAVTSSGKSSRAAADLPRPVAVPGGGWYRTLAAARPEVRRPRKTACGQVLGPDTMGVAHPVLPCGAKIFIAFGGKEVLTQVIDRGPAQGGHEFDLTQKLALRLGLNGVQPIRWSFASG